MQAKLAVLREKFERIEKELTVQRLPRVQRDGPYFAGASFSLVDAVFAPIFRYWNVFDEMGSFGVFDRTPMVQAWRAALAQRPSVQAAVVGDYDERLRRFLRERRSHLAGLIFDAVG
jgi:glutathione S-transferase